jgi:hypothetical protein
MDAVGNAAVAASMSGHDPIEWGPRGAHGLVAVAAAKAVLRQDDPCVSIMLYTVYSTARTYLIPFVLMWSSTGDHLVDGECALNVL